MNCETKTKRQSEMVAKRRTSYPPKGYGVSLQSDRIFYLLVLGLILSTNILTMEQNEI
tara:strand:+ start:651 stop:824 length:174 start_codon:yes stop_codon:yes gene_type:complete